MQDLVNRLQSAQDLTRQLLSVWESILNKQPVGINDDFFELGGDSILSIQIINKASQFGLHFTPRQLFQHQTNNSPDILVLLQYAFVPLQQQQICHLHT